MKYVSLYIRAFSRMICARSSAQTRRKAERFPQTPRGVRVKPHGRRARMYANAHTHTYAHMHTLNSLWCPEPVWPSAGMWSEAGNVWAMKACVYAGCSRPSPARGKTDTSAASFALHLTPSSPPNPDLFLTSGSLSLFRANFLFIPSHLFPLLFTTGQSATTNTYKESLCSLYKTR